MLNETVLGNVNGTQIAVSKSVEDPIRRTSKKKSICSNSTIPLQVRPELAFRYVVEADK